MEYIQRRATIALGESLSGEVALQGYRLVGIATPTDWDAATLTCSLDPDGSGTFRDVYDDAGELVLSGGGNRVTFFSGANASRGIVGEAIKIRSGTTGVPVNQTAARTIILLLEALN